MENIWPPGRRAWEESCTGNRHLKMKKEKVSSFGPLGQAVPEGHPVSVFLCLYKQVNLFFAQARLNCGSCHRRWRSLMAASLLASKSPSWDEYKTAISASPPRGWVRFISCFPFSPFSSLPQRKLQKPLRNGISKGEGTLSSDTNEVSSPVPARPSITQWLWAVLTQHCGLRMLTYLLAEGRFELGSHWSDLRQRIGIGEQHGEWGTTQNNKQSRPDPGICGRPAPLWTLCQWQGGLLSELICGDWKASNENFSDWTDGLRQICWQSDNCMGKSNVVIKF